MIKRLKTASEARLMPDKWYVEKKFFEKTGKKLDLDNPETFSEKIQFYKLYYKDRLFPKLADKYELKFYVERSVGPEYVIPTEDIYTETNSLKLENLPLKFALKATHGSGWNQVHFNHDNITSEYLQTYFRKWLNKSYFLYSKEWAYKLIPPRIICEKLLLTKDGQLPHDYKVYCFNGKPKFILRVVRKSNDSYHDFFDTNWSLLPFNKNKLNIGETERPQNLNEMVDIATKLSSKIPFVRIDFYSILNKLFVGEFTFYPDSGHSLFKPIKYEYEIGNMFDLKSLE